MRVASSQWLSMTLGGKENIKPLMANLRLEKKTSFIAWLLWG
jgi:hypothetical protein